MNDSILSNLFNYLRTNIEERPSRIIQEHNFQTFLNSICDINILYNEKSKCENDPNYKKDCNSLISEYYACIMIRKDIEIMFRNRQYRYFQDKKLKNV